MSDMNVIVIEGRLTKSAELSYFSDGTAYCQFSLANNESYKDQNGEYQNIPSFFECAMKGNYAKSMSQHLLKGRAVRIVGRLKQQRWEKDGQKYSRIIVKINALHLGPLPNKDNQERKMDGPELQGEAVMQDAESEYIPFESETDIPFQEAGWLGRM